MLDKEQQKDSEDCEKRLAEQGNEKDCLECSCRVCLAQQPDYEEKYLEALREIDTHIRATKEPIPYIVQTLKNVLPEYRK